MRTVRRARTALALVATTALLGACGDHVAPPRPRAHAAPSLTVVDASPHGRPGVLDPGHPARDLEERVRSAVEVRLTFDLHAAPPAATGPSYLLEQAGDGDRRTGALAAALRLAGHEAAVGDPVGPYVAGRGRRTFVDGDRALVVGPGPGTPWAYTRDGVRCMDLDVSEAANLASCLPMAEDDQGPGDRRSTPLTAGAARRAAAPVLAAAGATAAAAEVTAGWGTSVVSVSPTVGGLPTSGMATAVVVDAHGVLAAGGWLGVVTRGPDYPVLGAGDVVALWRGPYVTPSCQSPPPPGASLPEECGRPEVVVDTAVLGLERWSVDGVPALVPAWLYSSRARAWRSAVPAVTQAHLTPGMLPGAPVTAADAAAPAPAR